MSKSSANLLLISFDQWRGDWADPFFPVVNLPAVQELGKRSVVARRCYTSSPQCVPARLSWLTGLAPSQMGVTRNMVAEAPADAPSLFRELQQQGWYTELIGKSHWTNHRDPADLREKQTLIQSLGFDRVLEIAGPKALRHIRCALTDAWEQGGWLERYIEEMRQLYGPGQNKKAWAVRPSVLPDALYPDIWLTEKGLEALHRMPTQQPWLLWISFVGPHEPFDTPTRWRNTTPHPVREPMPEGEWIAQLPAHCELYRTHQRWLGRLSRTDIQACRQDYACRLQLLDTQMKQLLDALAKRDDADKTAIAVTADHGEMLGDHNMLYKGTFLEASIRVPFQYCPPPRLKNPPHAIKKPVGLTGLFTTMLKNLINGGAAETIVKTIKDTGHVCIEFGDEIMIIQNNRKLCHRLTGEALWATHLRLDPQEQINQLAIHPQLLRQNKKWINLANISKNELKKRQDTQWKWRNFTL